MNAEQIPEQYNDTYRNVGVDTESQEAFVIGQLLKNPGQVFDLLIAEKQREIDEATKAGADLGWVSALHFELKHLRMVRIESEGVHRNSQGDTAAE